MNVKTTFVNENIMEDVFMKQPDGFTLEGQVDKVFKLRKSICGLKQTLRHWNIYFDKVVREIN